MNLQATGRSTHRVSRRAPPSPPGTPREGRYAGHLTGALRTAVPLVAGLLIVALTVSLGNWQTRRAQEKADLQQRFNLLARGGLVAARASDLPVPGQPLRLEGEWLAQHGVLLDNRTQGGRAGYHVLTPLRLADGSGTVLVNRGWVAAEADRSRLPAILTPPGPQTVDGRMRPFEARPFSLGADVADGRRWQHLDVDRYRRLLGDAAGTQLAGWMVQQTSGAVDGLSRDWPEPFVGADRHRGYALQWYALAGLFAALTAWYAGRLLTRKSFHER